MNILGLQLLIIFTISSTKHIYLNQLITAKKSIYGQKIQKQKTVQNATRTIRTGQVGRKWTSGYTAGLSEEGIYFLCGADKSTSSDEY